MNCCWVPSVDVSLVGPKCRHLKLEIIFQYDDHSKMRADRIGSLKKFLHHFGARVGGDVVVFWSQTANHVAHTTTGEIGDVAIFAQARSNATRCSFHRRPAALFHRRYSRRRSRRRTSGFTVLFLSPNFSFFYKLPFQKSGEYGERAPLVSWDE